MSDHEPDGESLLDLVAECLVRFERDGERAFDEFCVAHPEHADALRVHVAQLRELGFFDRVDVTKTLTHRPPGADPRFETTRAPGAESPSDDAGAKSDRYVKKGEIARGGMGAVLRVFDRDLRRHLAMKVALTSGAPDGAKDEVDPQSLGRFLEEAQVTGQLEHPGIVPVHELGVDANGRVYFTMRLVQGETFREVIDHVHDGVDGWTRTRALGVLAKVCEAMAFAHEKRILHRDLKPANIMVGRFGETYVMDWGLARVLGRDDAKDVRLRPAEETLSGIRTDRAEASADDPESPIMTMDGDVVGTPAYMPPEQADGRVDELGPPADVYAVGAILYQLLCGHAPYVRSGARASPRAVLEVVLRGPPPPIEEEATDVPAELAAICNRAMAREPGDRYPEMGALSDDLRAFLEGRVVRAYRTGATAELAKWVTRNRAFAATLGAAMVVSSAIVAWSMGRIRDERNVAMANELAAERERARADAERVQVLRLSDVTMLHELVREEAELWPAEPSRVAAMRDWLTRAGDLVSKLPEHRSTLAALSDVDDTAVVKWQRGVLQDLVEGLERLQADDTHAATIASVESRRAFAATVVDRTIEREREAWNRAIRSIADPTECPRYDRLRVTPQRGLVPLGRDRRSGLWEFWHVQTGARPAWNDGGIPSVNADTGVVLVLLPKGVLRRSGEGDENEESAELLAVEPFFLSKYEVTQAQWRRITGVNPSYYPVGSRPGGHEITGTHPVEQVSWADGAEFARRLGLSLPSEVQWEYAGRAGTDTPWWCGSDPRSLDRVGNLADRSVERFGGSWQFDANLDDGYAVHAPVGTYLPNAFGLHDTIGNVAEWCSDPHSAVGADPAVRDVRVILGGSYHVLPARARSDHRSWDQADIQSSFAGVRVSRELED